MIAMQRAENIAEVLFSLGEVTGQQKDPKALEYLKEASEMYRSRSDRPRLAAALRELGSLTAQIKGPQPAMQHLQESLELLQPPCSGDSRQFAATLRALGTVTALNSDFKKAMEYFEKSLESCPQNDFEDVAHTLYELGRVTAEAGDPSKAIPLLEECLRVRRSLQAEPRYIAATLRELGKATHHAARHAEDLHKALCYLEKALEMKRSIYLDGPSPGTAETLQELASLRAALGHLPEAVQSHKESC